VSPGAAHHAVVRRRTGTVSVCSGPGAAVHRSALHRIRDTRSRFLLRVPADDGVRGSVGRGKIGLEVEERSIVETIEPDYAQP
jgi:hypothetical protein